VAGKNIEWLAGRFWNPPATVADGQKS